MLWTSGGVSQPRQPGDGWTSVPQNPQPEGFTEKIQAQIRRNFPTARTMKQTDRPGLLEAPLLEVLKERSLGPERCEDPWLEQGLC